MALGYRDLLIGVWAMIFKPLIKGSYVLVLEIPSIVLDIIQEY